MEFLKMTTIKIHNVETGEIIEREMNAEELAQQVTDQTAETARQAAEAQKAAAKQALLDKLGITAEEAQLLLGGN
jgi:hypothetical protein